MCVLDRNWVTAPDTMPDMIAASIVHEATHARLDGLNIQYLEPLRARIERLCDAESIAFARRVPNGESLARRIIESRPTDAAHWSDERLDDRILKARRSDMDAMRKELDDAHLPAWLKKLLQRLARSRAA